MKNKYMVVLGLIFISLVIPKRYVLASDGEEYITISVDAVDDNTNLQYAIDTDAPSAFSDSNEFTVPAGTSHTIYVKDAAGNVTSQYYEPEEKADYGDETETYDDGEEQRINIDLELGQKEAEEEIMEETGNPGTASVSSRVKTDGSVDAEKVFYTFTTKEGVELYLVVDQARGSDNVYLLDTVSLTDLRKLADNQESAAERDDGEAEGNLLSILAGEEGSDGREDAAGEEIQLSRQKGASSSFGSGLIILLLAGVGGGLYYYLKIYRNKKDEVMDALDAMDMEDFEAEDEEEEEVDFEYDEAEKERYLESLLDEDAEAVYVDADPDEYVASFDESDSDEESEDDADPFDDMEIGF